MEQASRRRVLTLGAGALTLHALGRTAHAACTALPPDENLLPRLSGNVLRVGRGASALTLAAASQQARDGDTIEVAAGEYRGDTATWRQSDILVTGIGGRPVLLADGRSAEDKAIFVIKGRRVQISNLEFRGARVRDRNGAGIRQEGTPLLLTDCIFADNENGVLCGNDAAMELAASNCVFVENGNASGSAHNLYAGTIARLVVQGCWFGRSRVGHLLKSRARSNLVLYSRLTGEDGTGSYELEFANGGDCLVLGCLIQQGQRSENSTIVSYGAEGYRWPDNRLIMAFNTIVNDREKGGQFVRVSPGTVDGVLAHNIFVGRGSDDAGNTLRSVGNSILSKSDFANPSAFDYRLRAASAAAGRAGFRGQLDPGLPAPTREYVHPGSSCPLEGVTPLTPLSPGAFQRLVA